MTKKSLELVHEGDERNTSSWKYLYAIFHKSKEEVEVLKQEILSKKTKLSLVNSPKKTIR